MKGRRKLLACLLSGIVLLGGLFSGCGRAETTPVAVAAGNDLRIMSFNVAGFGGNLLRGTRWTTRIHRVTQTVESTMPDSIGTQEMGAKWLDKLEVLLPQYAAVGVAREDGKEKGEYNSILYLKDKYELVDFGTFWLSQTPHVPSKYSDDTGCMRICTFAVLKNKQTGKSYVHLNTHLDNVSAQAREYGAKLVRSRAESFHLPVVITGDLNCSEEQAPFQTLSAAPFVNTQQRAPISTSDGTYHQWGALDPATARLDYCIVSEADFAVSQYRVLSGKVDGGYASDHYAVLAELRFL